MKQTFHKTYKTKYEEREGYPFHTKLYTVKAYDMLKTIQIFQGGCPVSNLPIKCKLNRNVQTVSPKLYDGRYSTVGSRLYDGRYSTFEARIYNGTFARNVKADTTGEVIVHLTRDDVDAEAAKTEILLFIREFQAFIMRNLTKSKTDTMRFKFVIVTDCSLVYNEKARHAVYETQGFSLADFDELVDIIENGKQVGKPANPIEAVARQTALAEMNDICGVFSKFNTDMKHIDEIQALVPMKGYDEAEVVEYVNKQFPGMQDRIDAFLKNCCKYFHEDPSVIKHYIYRSLLATFFRYLL